MAKCEVCHNEYDKAFEITVESKTHVFDSFEGAIHALAPKCAHCDCRIIGHGLEANDKIFCCNHCARQEGVDKLQDRSYRSEVCREISLCVRGIARGRSRA